MRNELNIDSTVLIYAHENGLISTSEFRGILNLPDEKGWSEISCEGCQKAYDEFTSKRAQKQALNQDSAQEALRREAS